MAGIIFNHAVLTWALPLAFEFPMDCEISRYINNLSSLSIFAFRFIHASHVFKSFLFVSNPPPPVILIESNTQYCKVE